MTRVLCIPDQWRKSNTQDRMQTIVCKRTLVCRVITAANNCQNLTFLYLECRAALKECCQNDIPFKLNITVNK